MYEAHINYTRVGSTERVPYGTPLVDGINLEILNGGLTPKGTLTVFLPNQKTAI